MPCIELHRPHRPARLQLRLRSAGLSVAVTLLLAACGTPAPPAPPPPQALAPVTPGTPGSPAAAKPLRHLDLPAPATPRTLLELRRQMAHRLVQTHPDGSYLGPAPSRLLAIPMLEIELNADGTVLRIVVLRHPETGDEATRLAIDAVYRAAPYGDVSHLPRPWKVVETFLFDDALRFKPLLLDQP